MGMWEIIYNNICVGMGKRRDMCMQADISACLEEWVDIITCVRANVNNSIYPAEKDDMCVSKYMCKEHTYIQKRWNTFK